MVEMKWWNLFLILSTMPGKKNVTNLTFNYCLFAQFCIRYFAHYHDIEEVNTSRERGENPWKILTFLTCCLWRRSYIPLLLSVSNQLWHPFLIDFAAAAGYPTGEREPSYSVIMMKLSTARTSVREWKVFSKRNSHAVINSHLIRTRQSRGKLGGVLIPLTLSLCLHLKILIFAFLKLF